MGTRPRRPVVDGRSDELRDRPGAGRSAVGAVHEEVWRFARRRPRCRRGAAWLLARICIWTAFGCETVPRSLGGGGPSAGRDPT